MSQGISTWHPSHQVAQKFTRTTFPFRLESLTSLPLTSCKVKSGASFRSFSGLRSGTGPEAEKLCQTATVHSRQRCASTRGAGRAKKHKQAARAAAAAQVHLLLMQIPLPSNSLRRGRAAAAFGCHSFPRFSADMRSSTHELSCVELFLSIALDVLLPECLLGAAEEGSNRGRI